MKKQHLDKVTLQTSKSLPISLSCSLCSLHLSTGLHASSAEKNHAQFIILHLIITLTACLTHTGRVPPLRLHIPVGKRHKQAEEVRQRQDLECPPRYYYTRSICLHQLSCCFVGRHASTHVRHYTFSSVCPKSKSSLADPVSSLPLFLKIK